MILDSYIILLSQGPPGRNVQVVYFTLTDGQRAQRQRCDYSRTSVGGRNRRSLMALAGLLLETQPFTGRIEDIYRHSDSVRVLLTFRQIGRWWG